MSLSWDERNLAQGRWFRTKLGPLNLALLRRHDEWRISTWEGEEFSELPEEGDRQDLPASLHWERWDCADDDSFTDRFMKPVA